MMRVVCFGNPIHGDDAVGYHVFERLKAANSGDLEVVFAGSSVLDAVRHFVDCDQVLVVDAHAPCGTPGKLRWSEIDDICPSSHTLSCHSQSIYELLCAMHCEGLPFPKIELLTIEAQSMQTFSLDLSPPVAANIDRLCDEIMQFAKYFKMLKRALG